ncbi:LrgB family protein [Fictibacillus barbaricus]|uniref:Murein hydrolase (TIGR00659 family) n=1 Tax=Fictibacillus barbaricus TaxID=182136 RepID=A0ABU1U1C8_9BACL|nr:LrgB family protein [Fictibacillus barbaricus]MDR7073248.1 putative murein hydrolase (TIGR00659 family) [Fictibacillus barbaricus]
MILTLEILSFCLTIFIFYMCKKLYARWTFVLLSPILITPFLLVVLLLVSHTPYTAYAEGTKWLTNLLGPATVAFAVPMYKHFHLLKKHIVEIILSLLTGSSVAIVSTFLFALWLQLSPSLINSLVPRSITTPIAMDISKTIGGIPTMTAVFVIVTGLTGTVIGPLLIRILSIKKSTSKGLMLGMGAHGTGTSRAFEIGELEGTFASLAMIVAAVITIILAFTIFPVLQSDLLQR